MSGIIHTKFVSRLKACTFYQQRHLVSFKMVAFMIHGTSIGLIIHV